MARELSRSRAGILGMVVIACSAMFLMLMIGLASRQGLWAETFELSVGFPEVHDIEPGTPVRIRGVDAGQVIAVEFPETDLAQGETLVLVRLKIDRRYEGRVYADSVARIQSRGLLSTQMIAIHPGTPTSGPLLGDRLRGDAGSDLNQVANRLSSVAERADSILSDIQKSQGTLTKLLKDDGLYADARGAFQDARKMISGVTKTVDQVQGEVSGLKTLVKNGHETVDSLRQNSDAIKAMPLVRGYVQDPVAILIRPDCDRSRQNFAETDVFEPGRAVLTAEGRERLINAANWLKLEKSKESDIVIVSFANPTSADQTSQEAKSLTQRQSEVVADFLKEQGVHKLGWWSRRKVTPIGYGSAPLPYIEKEHLPPAHVQIVLFVKRS